MKHNSTHGESVPDHQKAPAAGAFVEADLRTALSAPGVERLRDFFDVGPVQRAAVESFADALSSPTSKTAEPAEARDAARYRWLRDQQWNEAPMCVVVQPRKAVRLGHDCPSVDRLDAAIDEAMAAVPAEANNMEKKNAD